MIRRALSSALLVVLASGLAQAQGLEIDHKAVGCIVVGKYPKMNACFEPKQSFARGRVYFRPDGTPTWYYVEMKADQPCFAGILPKPGKKLVGQKIDYYVEGQDRALNSGRTQEYAPVVVRSESECKKDVPVAPFLNSATVAVFPALPAGFVAGGIGTGAILGIAAAGAAVAGTAVAVSNNSNNNTTTTTPAVNTTTTAPPATTVTTTTTTTTTNPSSTNHPPNIFLKTNPDPPQGVSPFTVVFDMCASFDPDGDPLTFFFDFGDGTNTSGPACSQSHTYTATSIRATGSGGARAASTSFTFTGSGVDPGGASGTRNRVVVVSPPATTKPTFTLTVLKNQAIYGTIMDNMGQINCDPKCSSATGSYAPGTVVTLTATPNGTFFQTWGGDASSCSSSPTCMITMDANKTAIAIFNLGFRGSEQVIAATSELAVPDGSGVVTIGGAASTIRASGTYTLRAASRQGTNTVQARLDQGSGAGTWRFEFPEGGIAAGSLRVLSGEVSVVTPNAIVFRLTGKAGETIAFTYDVE